MSAQPFPQHTINNSELREIDPPGTEQQYQLHIGLPYSYGDRPDKHYPVLYLLDAYWDFPLVSAIYGNLIYDEVIPEFLIVGIGYQGDDPDYGYLRSIDMSPTPVAEEPQLGGAPVFLQVLQESIIPFVESEYRIDPSYRVIDGSSFGGLFALYAMFEAPQLFQGIIASSPSVRYDDFYLFQKEAAFAEANESLNCRLFMSGAEEEWPDYLATVEAFNQILRRRTYSGFAYQYRSIDGERHAGTKAEAHNRGIRFAFAPLAPSAP
jgi:predicted alpha/beta superfamily hydrolase